MLFVFSRMLKNFALAIIFLHASLCGVCVLTWQNCVRVFDSQPIMVWLALEVYFRVLVLSICVFWSRSLMIRDTMIKHTVQLFILKVDKPANLGA